jgi:6-phosphogluconolactonase
MDRKSTLIVFEEKKSLVEFSVRLWREIYDESVTARGCMAVALSGGRTPEDFYRTLGRETADMGWKNIHIFLVDERFVPPGDRDSNCRMIRETVLDAVPIPEENIHPVRTSVAGPDEAAMEYEKDLKRQFGLKGDGFPRFDLMMLGLGEDGHTASLFPNTAALGEKSRLATVVTPLSAPHDRITLTFPVINSSRNIAFLIQGSGKAWSLKEILEKGNPDLPASRIKPVEGRLFFLADREAASLLRENMCVSHGTSGH